MYLLQQIIDNKIYDIFKQFFSWLFHRPLQSL